MVIIPGKSQLLLVLQLGFFLFLTAEATPDPYLYRYGSPQDQCLNATLPCGYCGPTNISVILVVQNELMLPHFLLKSVVAQRRRPLLYFLEGAANRDMAFRFNASYFGDLGFMVDSINHLSADVGSSTYWQIISWTGGRQAIPCGVSNYLPVDMEVILFNFTTY